VNVWNRYLDPGTGFQCLPFFDGTAGERVLTVDAPDDVTVVIQLDRPSSVFLEKLAYLQCPIPLLHPDSWNEHGNWVEPIGTGPYRLSEWRKGRYILLEKFTEYVPRNDPPSGLAGRKVAYVDYLRFVIIKDLMATKAALVSGQVDVAGSLAPVTALEVRHNKRVVAMDHAGLSRRTLLIQTADPLLSDVRIRRAMAHALDLETFAEVASLGTAPHNPSTLPLGILEHSSSDAPGYEYDVLKARALLDEAGYAGQEIILKTTRSEQAFFDIAMIAEAMWKKAGLSIRVEVMELGALLSDYLDGNYQVMAFEYTARFTPIMNFQTLLGNTALSPSRWGDRKANDLLVEATIIADAGRRKEIYEQIHRRTMEEVPVINLYNAPIVDVVTTRLDGYSPWIGAKPRLWNVRIVQ
jgi:peptide/nickel transport system substrate-binding protein